MSRALPPSLTVLMVEAAPAGRQAATQLTAAGAEVTLECSVEAAEVTVRRRAAARRPFTAVIVLGAAPPETEAWLKRAGHRGEILSPVDGVPPQYLIDRSAAGKAGQP